MQSKINIVTSTARNTGARKIILLCLTLSLVNTHAAGALADGGAVVMQYEFTLSNKPKFRQFNLAYRGDLGPIHSFGAAHVGASGMVVPLYSLNPQTPGLFNHRYHADLKANGASNTGNEVAGALVYFATVFVVCAVIGISYRKAEEAL